MAKKKASPAAAPATPAPVVPNKSGLISNQQLIELYALMVKCRMLEEHTRAHFAAGRFSGVYDPAVGREAAAVGVLSGLEAGDIAGGAALDRISTQFIAGV